MGRGKDRYPRIRRTKEEIAKGVPLNEVKRVRGLSVSDNADTVNTDTLGDFQPEQEYATDLNSDTAGDID